MPLSDIEKELLKEGNYTVRRNLLEDPNYRPYCGAYDLKSKCSIPRANFDGEQFVCSECGYRTEFPKKFIDYYKLKWNK